jgi:hypothetical protein
MFMKPDGIHNVIYEWRATQSASPKRGWESVTERKRISGEEAGSGGCFQVV